MPVTSKVASRISSELKRYQSILAAAKQRDIIKRDLIDSDESKAAAKMVQKLQRSRQRKREQGADQERSHSSPAQRHDSDGS